MRPQKDVALLDSKKMRFFSYFQIVSGVAGLILFAFLFDLSFAISSGRQLAVNLIVFGIYSVQLVSGAQLFVKRKQGYYTSAMSQFLQLPYIDIVGIKYYFTSIVASVFGLNSNFEVLLYPSIGLKSLLTFGNSEAGSEVGINLVALLLLIFILSEFKRARSKHI